MPELPLTIEEAAGALRAGDLTSVELTTAVLERADRHDGWLGSFLARFPDTALAIVPPTMEGTAIDELIAWTGDTLIGRV